MDPDSVVNLDLLSQLPSLHLYTQICFCFPVTSSSSHSKIITTLTKGLQRLSAAFPWTSGQVVKDLSSGLYKIILYQPTPPLIIKDLRDDPAAPTMDALRATKFPISMLNADLISPRKPWIPPNTPSPNPVFIIQANFIPSGLLLVICGHHQVMGMNGQAQLIHLLAKACRSEPFTDLELESGNISPRNFVPHLSKPISELQQTLHLQLSPSRKSTSITPNESNSIGINLTFPASSLATLKSLATSTLPSNGPTFISTDDALAAFIWRLMSLSRLRRLPPDTPTTLARPVDAKRFLGISSNFPGLCQNCTYHTSILSSLTSEPLGHTAASLRAALDPATSKVGYNTSALATYIHHIVQETQGKESIKIDLSGWLDPDRDLCLSSWAKETCYEEDWGWGEIGAGSGERGNGGDGKKAEAVRKPSFDPLWNLGLFMPRREDGEIVVAMSVRREEVEGVKWELEEGVGKGLGAWVDV